MGSLYIIATPIGNLGDISARALETLRAVDFIAAEDTRHSKRLLDAYQIKTPMLSYHAHNEATSSQGLISLLQQGKSIALITDAGTPLISDPGYRIVHDAHVLNIPVVPIPGACAAIAALSASGLPSDKFIFEGFLPAKSHARGERLRLLKTETRTMIFYEAPHRILESLEDMREIFGDEREAVLARELTKTFEEITKSSLKNLLEKIKNTEKIKGECVFIIAGHKPQENSQEDLLAAEKLFAKLLPHMGTKQAVEIIGDILPIAKNILYERALAWKNENIR